MIFCRELNKHFDSEEQLFSELKTNKEDILALKRAKIMKSCEKGVGIPIKSGISLKTMENIKDFTTDDDHYYIVVNATKILDSHGDMHTNGIWKKTLKDNQGKNYLVADHKLEMDKVIAKKSDIQMFTAEIPFSAIGKSYEGETQALIYKVAKDKIIHPLAKEWLEDGDDIQASVRMRYITIKMAMRSTREEDKEEMKTYNEFYDQIANKEDYEDIPYFFVVTEAENVKESSLVLFASNSSTGVISIPEPPTGTQKETSEPTEEVTQKRRKSII
jgi:hypothetical protein